MDHGMVLIPGAMLGPHQPLLSYTWLAGRARDAEAYHVEWPADRPSFADLAAAAPWVIGQIAAALAALRQAGVPYLLIGGTADPHWNGELARTLTPHVVEIPDADHGMIVVGEPLARSAAVLGRVVTAIENFLDVQVWPTRH